MRKTKIVCTVGPACCHEAVLEEMLLSGMNVARFNFSHGDHEYHKEMMDTFRSHAAEAGAEFMEGKVLTAARYGENWYLGVGMEMVEASAVILAAGVARGRKFPGEEEYLGRGVSYCATCDGFLYKGKTIAVVCTTKRLEHEIGYLADFAKKIYLIPMYKGVDIERNNITVIRKMPTRIEGGKRVENLVFATPPSEEIPAVLPVDGVFMLRDGVSPAVLVGGLATDNGHVVVSRDMSTNIKGCYAAGDCTGRPYQYAKAVGEGNIAGHSVTAYLSENK